MRRIESPLAGGFERGRVELLIETAAAQSPDTGSRIVFTVTDTGIGISPDNLTSIFSAFQQGDGTTSRRYGGTTSCV